VSEQKITLLLGEAHGDPPTPWSPARQGQVWTTSRPVEDPGDGPRPLPALVTMGRGENTPLILLNMEHAGVVSLAGATRDRIDTMRTMALELAVSPLADAIHVLCVGFANELDGFERVTVLASLDEAAALIRRHAADAAEACAELSAVAGRAREAGDWNTWAPLVVFAPEASAEECDELLAAANTTADGGVVAVVTAQDVHTVYELAVTADTIKLPTLDQVLTRRNVSADEATGVWDLIEDARTDQVEPDADLFDDAAYGTVSMFPAGRDTRGDRDVYGPADDADLADVAHLDHGHHQHHFAELDDGYDDEDTLATDIDLRDQDPADGDDESDPLPVLDHDWVLRVLGPVELLRSVDGSTETPGRGGGWALLSYLAFHRAGVPWDTLFEAAWRGDQPANPKRRVNANIAELRQRLGIDTVTGELHIPNLPSNGQGRYTLGPRVITDWEQFQALVEFAARHEDERDRALHAALELVRGEPFEGAQIPWVEGPTEQHLRQAVTKTARTYGQRALEENRLHDVEWGALTGLAADRYDAALHGIRLRAAIAADDAHHVDDVWNYYVASASADDGKVESSSDLDPELAELYGAFRRRNPLNWAKTAG
jgi:hypothetical protein